MAALERGLTMSDVRRMPLGAVVDFVIAYNERNEQAEKENGKTDSNSRLEPRKPGGRAKYRLASKNETAAWAATLS